MLHGSPSTAAEALVSARLKARHARQGQATSPVARVANRSDHPGRAGSSQPREETLAALAREVRSLETSGRRTTEPCVLSTGCAALDACLPAGGYLPGSVVEYLRTTPACGASYLALAAAATAMRAQQGFLVVVDSQQTLYPPALLSQGIDLERVIFVHPDSQADAIWAVDQALRTHAVAAVVADLELLDDRAARRLQLAAERGNGLGLLLRSIAARRSPSWAEVQWIVRGAKPAVSRAATPPQASADGGRLAPESGRLLHVQLARVRGGAAGAQVCLEINASDGSINASTPPNAKRILAAQGDRQRHEQQHTSGTTATRAVRLASELAGATRPSRRTSAG